MSFYSGCPSWVAAHRAEKTGYASGYHTASVLAEEKIKKLVLSKINPETKKQFEIQLKEELKKQIDLEKEEILNKEKIRLQKSITKEVTKEVYNKVIKEVEEYKTKIKDKDNIIFLPNLKIIVDNSKYDGRVENFVGKKFESMGYEVEYCMSVGKGHPDLICKKGLEQLYVEVKSPTDGLHLNQAKWILQNKNKQFILYFIDKWENSL